MIGDIEVTIQSILPSDEPQGCFRLHISPEATVEELLKKVCHEAGSAYRPDYCLRSKSHEVLVLSDTLARSGVQDGAFLHWTSESVEQKIPCHCNTFWVLALGSFIIGTVGIVAICIVRFKDTSPVYDFAVVFDAGSTHTAMFIYKWEGSKLNGTAVAAQFGSKCTADGNGIAEFAENPQEAGKSLQSCIDVAKGSVPSQKYSNTPIYLGATAGMRLLRIRNATASDAILDSIRETFKQSAFKFVDPAKSVRIISGSEEGTFSWITSNYVTNAFKVKRPGVQGTIAYTIVPTIGALDLGGASTQITFIPKNSSDVPSEYSLMTNLFGRNYSVYTHSYLCYGVVEVTGRIFAALVQEQANRTLIQHPCLPKGYNETLTYHDIFSSPCTHGGEPFEGQEFYMSSDAANVSYTFVGLSNGTECSSLLDRSIFNRTLCPYKRCSFNGVYQPEVTGPFYAFSSFYYVSSFLNLSTTHHSSFKHSDFLAAIDNICKSNWTQLQELPVTPEQKGNLMFYCLQSSYIDLLLYDGYGFNDSLWSGINFVGQVSMTEVGWTLGFILDESENYPIDMPEEAIYTWSFALLMVLFVLFLIVSVGLVAQGKRVRVDSTQRYRRMSQYGAI